MCPPKAYAPLSLLLRTTAAAGCARAGPRPLPRPIPTPCPAPVSAESLVFLPAFFHPGRHFTSAFSQLLAGAIAHLELARAGRGAA